MVDYATSSFGTYIPFGQTVLSFQNWNGSHRVLGQDHSLLARKVVGLRSSMEVVFFRRASQPYTMMWVYCRGMYQEGDAMEMLALLCSMGSVSSRG